VKLPLHQFLIPEYRFPIPLNKFEELACYHYYDGPICFLATDKWQKYLGIFWDDDRTNQVMTHTYFPVANDDVLTSLEAGKLFLKDFELSVPYILVTKTYYKDSFPVACWKVSPLLITDSEIACPDTCLLDSSPYHGEKMNLVVENIGKERASYVVGFQGHLNSETKTPVYISKRSVEVLKQMIDLGKSFGAGDKLEKGVIDRLKGFPNGEDITAYLENNGISVLEYVENASKAFEDAVKASGNTGERAKRGQGYISKSQKFATASMAKLVCLLAPASTTGKITDEMLEAGFIAAIEMIKVVDKTAVVAKAKAVAEKTGLDSEGRVRLRSESTTATEDSE
jgi:hypothetical protein